MKLQVDLRDLPGGAFLKAVRSLPNGVGVMMTAWQWSLWLSDGGDSNLAQRSTVMAPDFLHYARLAGTGQPREILKLPGSAGKVAAAALACAPAGVGLLPGLASGDFWAAVKAMIRYDLALLGKTLGGEVVLHYNLTDFACLFERVDVLTSYIKWTQEMGATGFATQQVPALLSLCSRTGLVPDRLVFPTGMGRPEAGVFEAAARRQFGRMKVTADFTQWPGALLGAAKHNKNDFS